MKPFVKIAMMLGLLGAGFLTYCKVNEAKVGITPLLNDWEIYPAQKLQVDGGQISSPDFDSNQWLKGSIPATVMSILRQNGEYQDMFMGKNIEAIDKSIFTQPWWYRKTFVIDGSTKGLQHTLRFEGLNYKANIWLNGTLIADSAKIEGPFSRWELAVTGLVKSGKNTVAVEIIPPKRGDLTIGFVDWNPAAPDENMGLWRGVELIQSGAITVESPLVQSKVANDRSSAALTVKVLAKNRTGKAAQSSVNINMTGIGELTKHIELKPWQEMDVVFTPEEFPALNVDQPKLWWPNNMGDATLHPIEIVCNVNGRRSASVEARYGIREITQYLTEDGHKGFKINHQPVVIKGAGWVDDMMLADDDAKVIAQVDYVKHMNMNCIRLEGFWGKNKTLYERADENGLLVMVGWSCHWEWEGYCGRPETNFMAITGEEEIERHAQSYKDQVHYLRQHPSVFMYVFGSDKLPVPQLERKLNDYIGQADGTRPILASCKFNDYGTDFYFISEVSGPTGVKMLGPYGYVPPVFWYIDTASGGAYGFNTETGPGPQVPPYESLVKMIPEKDLWPINDVWNYHCGRNEFNTLDRYLKAFNNRYGEAVGAEDFTFRSQMSNYEAIRPMFEAFQVNRHQQATGVIQWMLNSAWPEMYWQLYDYYLLPNGAFYGTKKACQPLNPIYNYKNNSIYVVNDYLEDRSDLILEVRVFNHLSKEVFDTRVEVVAKAGQSINVLELPTLENVKGAYFLSLALKSGDSTVSDNFYWLSTKDDVMDFSKTTWVVTPQKEFADLKALNKLAPTTVTANWQRSADGDIDVFECTLENTGDKIAFFIELGVLNAATSETLLPVFWDDNYVSLLPGQKKIIKARVSKNITSKVEVVDYKVKGLNITN